MNNPKKPNIFIRGIYSTALTKLFTEAGYPIIFPSKEIQKRFKIPFRPIDNYSKDISIRNRLDLQGVSILFKKHVWEQLVKENFEDFPFSQKNNPNLIVFQARFHKNAIYRGLIVKSNRQNNYSYIRLVPEKIDINGVESEFSTTIGRYPRFIENAKEGIFQITHEDSGINHASLGSFFTIPGDLIVIVPYNDRVIISKEIVSGKKKKWLFDLGKEIQQSKKYGFIFRTAAALASEKEIMEEVERLEEDLIQTQNTITKFPDKIGEIFSNYRSLNVIFPAQVKHDFDRIRREIIPTLEGHHCIKSNSKPKFFRQFKNDKFTQDKKPNRDHREEKITEEKVSINQQIMFTETLIKGLDKTACEIVYTNYFKEYYNEFLKPRKTMNILHQKLNGKTIRLSPGIIQSIEKESNRPTHIVLKRKLLEGGLYDGLNTPIERGDYAIGEYTIGNWYYISSYYSKRNEFKGRYYNINTPIEISQLGLRYVDLEIDVVENMVMDKKIIDKEYLEQALLQKIISQEIFDKAFGVAENIIGGRIKPINI